MLPLGFHRFSSNRQRQINYRIWHGYATLRQTHMVAQAPGLEDKALRVRLVALECMDGLF